ncbi:MULTISPECIES: hypothetical protein [unclassified Paenibacillus]|uniref:hypothetical protein n=1 Tax=unclassified Paenibacillus TaxID=185978 RepID=UPI000955E77F|nr:MULTISPECIES: hypothetical protein [unclassified Paenibacillus]ASS64913.2 hypothetical protein CIC07_01385 [Paenibacillus sp. RUD330]SIR01706.1 hypothetical protein SAMN05880555_2777 [Paenibacillus sp. RU4X]SIR33423.1 hypothetical protein SAMN05880570_3222 [Paenibacillus sp. RU4T]
MLCPNDHMVMNHSETDGISIHKCPVCGSVRLTGHEEDKLAFGGVELYPYTPGPAADPEQEAPFGAGSAEAGERASSRDEQVTVYGAPDPEAAPGAGSSPYGYVPAEAGALAIGTADEGYGMPPAEFGRAQKHTVEQAMQGSHAYQPLPSKN